MVTNITSVSIRCLRQLFQIVYNRDKEAESSEIFLLVRALVGCLSPSVTSPGTNDSELRLESEVELEVTCLYDTRP